VALRKGLKEKGTDRTRLKGHDAAAEKKKKGEFLC